MTSDDIQRRIAERRAAGDYDDAAMPDDPDRGLRADTGAGYSAGSGIVVARIRGELANQGENNRHAQLWVSLGLALAVVAFLVGGLIWPGFLLH